MTIVSGGAAGVLLLAFVAGWLLRARRRMLVVSVVGPSMLPVLEDGSRVLVRRVRLPQLRCGQIAVFGDPSDRYCGERRPLLIKRVVALPGDPIPAALVPYLPAAPALVPAGRFLALSDNPTAQWDSRRFGHVAGGLLVGVVRRRLSADG